MTTEKWLKRLSDVTGIEISVLRKLTPRQIEEKIGPLKWQEEKIRGGLVSVAVESLTDEDVEELHKESSQLLDPLLKK